jgi:hypothetical protein
MKLSGTPNDVPEYLKDELTPWEKLLPAMIALLAAYVLVR